MVNLGHAERAYVLLCQRQEVHDLPVPGTEEERRILLQLQLRKCVRHRLAPHEGRVRLRRRPATTGIQAIKHPVNQASDQINQLPLAATLNQLPLAATLNQLPLAATLYHFHELQRSLVGLETLNSDFEVRGDDGDELVSGGSRAQPASR